MKLLEAIFGEWNPGWCFGFFGDEKSSMHDMSKLFSVEGE